MKFVKYLLLLFIVTHWTCSASVQVGPYTVHEISDQVYRIEDANDSNPPGIVWGEDGKPVSFNNCSDMYLIVGTEIALLIDLSNAITWASNAEQALYDLVFERVGDRSLVITFTHNHGDHLGMLPAFAGDPRVQFHVNEAEFLDENHFPNERTMDIGNQGRMDLGGGVYVDYFELPGHTEHSTVFFLKRKNLLFSGDAIGSGDDVWLFDYESFPKYEKSIHRLIQYICDPANGINKEELTIFGGHYWQKGDLESLKVDYVYDMKILVQKIGEGTAESKELKTFLPFLNVSFKYESAGIAWNRDAARQYQASLSNP